MIILVPPVRRKGRKMAKKLGSFEKVVMLHKSKSWSIDEVHQKSSSRKNINTMNNRILISIIIVGSSGPLLIVVNEDAVVSKVIEMALKSYARQGRLPVLGSDATDFVLYGSHAVSDALCPSVPIGSFGTRKFLLCGKHPSLAKTEVQSKMMPQKGSGGWKSFSFKVRSALVCAIGGRA